MQHRWSACTREGLATDTPTGADIALRPQESPSSECQNSELWLQAWRQPVAMVDLIMQ